MSAVNPPDESEAVVARLWQEFRSEPWPARLNGAELVGIELVTLDADLAGCVHSWLNNGGYLDPRRRRTLNRRIRELEQVLPQLTEADAPQRWHRLHQMAQRVSGDSPYPTN
ncbi:hypothetical protein FCH28_06030 [Streptomyces piniterrae]|uniref:Uncharacterized protein n=1 Tax=Streptomyces piniterrae TaxID=2571125 RepID=A0A4U0NSJ3_9ACTN|nr:hypothetical protein FCH28_06030 [Streptomyces piniterrae]